jgi:Domain of unknown function (DUF1937)
MNDGHIVFSPISHSHPIAVSNKLPGHWEFWKKFDESFIEWCDELHVICLHRHKDEKYDGALLIQNSKGVQSEIGIARSLNKEIKSFHYHGENF